MINQLPGWIVRHDVETGHLHAEMCAKRIAASGFKINSLKASCREVFDHTIVFQHQGVNANDLPRTGLCPILFRHLLQCGSNDVGSLKGCVPREALPSPHFSPGRLSASKRLLGFTRFDRDVDDRADGGLRWPCPRGSFGPVRARAPSTVGPAMLSVASTRTEPKSSAIITAPGEKCGLVQSSKPVAADAIM